MRDLDSKDILTLAIAICVVVSALIAYGFSLKAIFNPVVLYLSVLYLLWPYRSSGIGGRLIVVMTVLLAVWGIYKLGRTLSPFLVGLGLAYMFDPLVVKLERYIPRSVGIALVMLALVIFVLGMAFFIAFPAVKQMIGLTNLIYDFYTSKVVPYLSRGGGADESPIRQILDAVMTDFKSKVPQIASSIGGYTFKLFSNVASALLSILGFIVVPVITFYMLSEIKALKGFAARVVDRSPRSGVIKDFLRDVDESLSQFLRGQLAVSSLVALLTSFGLFIIGLLGPTDLRNYALLVGIIAGIANMIPYIGAILGAIPGILICLSSPGYRWYFLVAVIGWFFVVQFTEGNFISPKLMGRTLNLNPVLILVAVFIGSDLIGPVGMLLAIPSVCVIRAGVRTGIRMVKAETK
ncbi:TPA: AI-2E family transporter [Candidatus Poribacteria bacterium]|nr:AI-2E family transporter [Candidatus Poribacteria bacterium]HEX29117.1 AI-2E family transporter [Candidatus Poribacteria bacterium]